MHLVLHDTFLNPSGPLLRPPIPLIHNASRSMRFTSLRVGAIREAMQVVGNKGRSISSSPEVRVDWTRPAQRRSLPKGSLVHRAEGMK